ncbi:MAG: AMP-binding protein [Cyclobacteriaceae bacterium]|nr:AMP-binding protein [Cyclobacteriaceae bacterium]
MKDYPWYKNYPKGISHEVNPDRFDSVIDLLESTFKKYGDKIAYESMGKTLTFHEVDKLSAQFADYLQNEVGLVKGDRIAVQMPNVLQWVIAVFGALRAGMIVVNTNPLYTAREMKHQFTDTRAKAVVILANFAQNLEKILPETQIETVIITEVGDMLGGLKKPIVNFVVKHIKKMVPAYHIKDAIPFAETLRKGDGQRLVKPKFNNEEVAFLQYTGGTTGVSKGAMLTHRNILANMEQISAWMAPKLLEGEETVVTALPMYHIFALTVNCLAMLKYGARNILITNPRDMPVFIKTLKKYPFSILTGVNTLFNGLLNQPEFKNIDFSNFKIAVGGGMAVQDAVAIKWKQLTNVPLAEGYGLTETSPVLCCNPIDGTERLGYIGLPVPSTEIRIMDEMGKELPTGEPGEICAKGPQIMKGYWEKPDETDNVFYNGYFKTGDIGFIDEDGFVKIVDRKKEMINVSGFNVFPNEIENVISSHEKVLEVGAIGISDPRSTEKVKVFIVKKDESLTEAEIIAYCKENMTPYKVPKQVEFRKELPKSNVGKILRRILKEEEEARPKAD